MDLQRVGRGMDWIEMAQDRDRWRALVNVVMNLRVRYGIGFWKIKQEIFRQAMYNCCSLECGVRQTANNASEKPG
jgi:hypothetical protein